MTELGKIINDAPDNFVIRDALARCYEITQLHNKIMCSVSGGADSDVMLDMLIRCGAKEKTAFVFFDTGLEYAATKEHLEYLERKYGISIICERPIKSIPKSCLEYGVPFWSKDVSAKLYSLQSHGFQWEDMPFDELIRKYPGCNWTLSWWCNERPGSRYNISHIPYLKEFIIRNPPKFKISKKCCDNAKKNPSHRFEKAGNFDLVCIGVRRAEGGVRATAYKNCFSQVDGDVDRFRPIFWLRDSDKSEYCEHYSITHSRCYTQYGMNRTGCFGCPFAKDFEKNLALIERYEPKLLRAANSIFGDSYDYTRRYLEFREEMKCKKAT